VSFTSGPFGRSGANEIHKIMHLLPPEEYNCQYRIGNANEPHEYGAKESQLDSYRITTELTWLPRRRNHDV